MKRTFIYSAIFIAGFVAISVFNFYQLTHPRKIEIATTPKDFHLPAEEITVKTRDGISISGYHIKSERSPEQLLVLLHGYPANKRDLIPFAEQLYPEFSLLLIDFRYFGDSGGTASTLGMHEVRDLAAALDFAGERYEHIGVFGYSYGGAVALQTAAQDTRIDAVASYSAPANLRLLGYDVYSNLWILKYPMVELLNLWGYLVFGTWIDEVSPAHAATDIKAPVFIGHTDGDPLIPFHHAQKIVSALSSAGNEPVTYFPKGDSHMGLPYELPEKLILFFERNL